VGIISVNATTTTYYLPKDAIYKLASKMVRTRVLEPCPNIDPIAVSNPYSPLV